jgi:hypothetical protein
VKKTREIINTGGNLIPQLLGGEITRRLQHMGQSIYYSSIHSKNMVKMAMDKGKPVVSSQKDAENSLKREFERQPFAKIVFDSLD